MLDCTMHVILCIALQHMPNVLSSSIRQKGYTVGECIFWDAMPLFAVIL